MKREGGRFISKTPSTGAKRGAKEAKTGPVDPFRWPKKKREP